MDVGVRRRVDPLGKKMQVEQDKKDRNFHCTCNGLIILTVVAVWQLRIIIEFPIKFYRVIFLTGPPLNLLSVGR